MWSGSTRESVYTFQAQKSNVQFLAIAYEHARECERVLNPGASLNPLVVVIEVVVPDVELLEIGHLKYSLIVLEDLIEQISVSLTYKKYNITNCYKNNLQL